MISLYIQGRPSLENYFTYMMIFSSILVLVAAGSFFYPVNKAVLIPLFSFLTLVSLGLNMKVISMILSRKKQ